MTAMPAAERNIRQSGRCLRKYPTPAVRFPTTWAVLFVPTIVATGVSVGKPTNKDGSMMSPPPPTTALTHPAMKAARTRPAKTHDVTCQPSV